MLPTRATSLENLHLAMASPDPPRCSLEVWAWGDWVSTTRKKLSKVASTSGWNGSLFPSHKWACHWSSNEFVGPAWSNRKKYGPCRSDIFLKAGNLLPRTASPAHRWIFIRSRAAPRSNQVSNLGQPWISSRGIQACSQAPAPSARIMDTKVYHPELYSL